jgi:hypothetical protein
MTKTILLGLITVLFFSCVNDDNDVSIKQEEGEVWLSGGLGVCAAQIHLDNGDTLIVHLEDVLSFRSGDRVSVKYEEIGPNESCSSGTDCEVIVIKMIQ